MASRGYKSPMSNELLFVAVALGIVIALLLARSTILDAPTHAILQRVGQVVHESDPDLRARVSLQELQQPAGSMRPADEEEVGR